MQPTPAPVETTLITPRRMRVFGPETGSLPRNAALAAVRLVSSVQSARAALLLPPPTLDLGLVRFELPSYS